MIHTLEGGTVARPKMSSGTVDEVTEAWALIGVLTVAWWAARNIARLARRATRR